jgi:hypothetical protein
VKFNIFIFIFSRFWSSVGRKKQVQAVSSNNPVAGPVCHTCTTYGKYAGIMVPSGLPVQVTANDADICGGHDARQLWWQKQHWQQQ